MLSPTLSPPFLSSLLVLLLLELDDLVDVRERDLLHVAAGGAVADDVERERTTHVEQLLEAHLGGGGVWPVWQSGLKIS